ncbi:hypothetical protein LIER_26859 [Lithospermum erythrorhizon]|uniref:Polymerase nucleotidyl transferase domain-containing protein n=1 Tax=Lithospermum erythrorhizon TaxID=34254 RepID=A0AAV3R9W7_LITER
MGESEAWPEPIGLLPNGLSPNAGPMVPALDLERWMKAEERTAELIACIQPNPPSEERRTAVADYVQRLIAKCFPCQVFTFGSVPLKTYLPDGDIDLTAFSNNQSLKDSWATQVRDMLEKEEKDENADFSVKDVQYIQAEVKLIKCLVDNIVVDISFNQLGGLCTLCFLEEVDNLISQDHLFKRSVILIKAWCYYESRILGAHHGLISTYALETLVLYIFHVFNNSFAGPLEVLYRFLEFFSNFDFDNFCVSLWGPVPISSLPDVTAEPPRKDGGELLLSKLFLDACSSVYAVFPGGQETYGQPFVSKHFNVIDPLRVNNNLGRSVSKGNFYRIRSAFTFGAKRLARLLDCPKEDLVSEVNQFFMNTWGRHGSGNRPDAPGTNLEQLKLSTTHHLFVSDDSRSDTGETQNGRNRKRFGSSHGNKYSSGSPSQVVEPSHAQSRKTLGNTRTLGNTGPFRDQTVRDHNFNQGVLSNGILRHLKSEILPNDANGRFLFARTHSSPELTDSYCDTASHRKPNRAAENSKVQASFSKVENTCSKNLGPENGTSYSSRFLNDGSASVKFVPSTQDLDTADSDIGSNHHQQSSLDGPSEEHSSAASVSGMQQEEQDLVNIMASSNLNGFRGQVPVPFNLASAHLPFPISPLRSSMGYNQPNMPTMVPANIPLVDPSFADVQFHHGLVTSPITPYFPGYAMSSASEDAAERNIDNFGPIEMNSGDFENEHWQERDEGQMGAFDLGNRNHERLHQADKLQTNAPDVNLVAPSWASGSGHSISEQRHFTDGNGSAGEADNLQLQDDRGEYYAEERAASSRFSSAARSNSLRSKTSSESSWDGSSNSMKGKRGKKEFYAEPAMAYSKGKLFSETMPTQNEVDELEWNSVHNMATEITPRRSGPQSVTSFPGYYNSYHEALHASSTDSTLPTAPMLIGPDSRQRRSDDSGLVAFYPTGPPVPFLTMLPVYNAPHETSVSDASTNNFARVEGLDKSYSSQNIDSTGAPDQSQDLRTSSSIRRMDAAVIPKEPKSDILNSDFASHWQNLQFGRFCQSPSNEIGHPIYPSPLMVPPVYLQGGFPSDGSGRPLSANMNILSQLIGYGPRLAPVAPVPSASSGPPNVYQYYADEIPRQRSGTGTYLPNPKISPRERPSSGAQRGSYNYNRNENHGGRDGNWNSNAKQRVTPGSQNRDQAERLNSRLDWFPSEGRADRAWSSHRHDLHPSYQSQNGPLRSNPSNNGPPFLAYNMYSLPDTRANGSSPNGANVSPVMMLYPFHQNYNLGPHGEQLEFGTMGLSEGSHLKGSINDPRFHGRSDHRSSPDQPSSPPHHRILFSASISGKTDLEVFPFLLGNDHLRLILLEKTFCTARQAFTDHKTVLASALL